MDERETARHRNLFNGDWGTLFWAPQLWQPEGGTYSAVAIDRFVERLAASGVDTFVISPNTQVAWYPSQTVPRAWDGYTRGDRRWENWLPGIAPETNLAMMDRYLDLLEAGTDWLARAIDDCRRVGMSPWLSVRMNDMHGAGDPANPINCPLFRDRRYRLSGRKPDPQAPASAYWQALSYERAEVRDYMLAMIRELVFRYDGEGLELDWLRNPAICEPGADQHTTDQLTQWIGAIRGLTLARARQSGRAYPLGLRVPPQFAMLREVGLDLEALVARGLIDFVSVSNFMQTAWDMPFDALREELGGSIALYGATELIMTAARSHSLTTGRTSDRYVCASAPALRANAAGKLVLGVDGIEHYNFYAADEDNAAERICTLSELMADYSAIRQVHDLGFLRGQPKHYALGAMSAPCWYPPFDLPEPLPVAIGPGERRSFRLPLCAEPLDRGLQLAVQVVVSAADAPLRIGVSVNGGWPTFDAVRTNRMLFPNPTPDSTHHAPGHQAYGFVLPVAVVRDGWNTITVYHRGSEGAQAASCRSVEIRSLELGVRPQEQSPG